MSEKNAKDNLCVGVLSNCAATVSNTHVNYNSKMPQFFKFLCMSSRKASPSCHLSLFFKSCQISNKISQICHIMTYFVIQSQKHMLVVCEPPIKVK